MVATKLQHKVVNKRTSTKKRRKQQSKSLTSRCGLSKKTVRHFQLKLKATEQGAGGANNSHNDEVEEEAPATPLRSLIDLSVKKRVPTPHPHFVRESSRSSCSTERPKTGPLSVKQRWAAMDRAGLLLSPQQEMLSSPTKECFRNTRVSNSIRQPTFSPGSDCSERTVQVVELENAGVPLVLTKENVEDNIVLMTDLLFNFVQSWVYHHPNEESKVKLQKQLKVICGVLDN